jgi:hypothetical protein
MTANISIDPARKEEFSIRLRDIVARGRAAGIIAIGATQRPSADIIPPSLRDTWGYRRGSTRRAVRSVCEVPGRGGPGCRP